MIKTVDMEIDKNYSAAMFEVQIHSGWYHSGEIGKKENKKYLKSIFKLILLCSNYAYKSQLAGLCCRWKW